MNTSYAPPPPTADLKRVDFRFPNPRRPPDHPAAEKRPQTQAYPEAPAPAPETCPYSGRQLEVLRLLAEGHSSAECARLLDISTETVRTHRQHILQRSTRRNMVSLLVEAVRRDWI